MEKLVTGCLVDTVSKQTYELDAADEVILASNASLSASSIVIAPVVAGEGYVVKLESGSLYLLEGECAVDGKPMLLHTSVSLSPGAFITLGSARALQYVLPETNQQTRIVRRVLPPTPGKALDGAPPSKPQRLKKQEHSVSSRTGMDVGDNSLDAGIRTRLQRIAAEVSARVIGYEGRKPPPPYEQVGNSIAYQLLHQQQHKMVTCELIDALYPALKENELKDSSLLQTYSSYLQTFKDTLEQPASLQCMLPADLPTCDFLIDMLLHLCCMPHMTALAEKQGGLWCELLAVFSQSEQNQHYMSSQRHPSKVLSCMHLNIMSPKLLFQQYGWTVLASTIATPTPAGGKPVLSEPSLTLALSLTERQLSTNSSNISLVVAIVSFLARVANVAKMSVTHGSTGGQAYTEDQGRRILALFQDKLVLRQVMQVPPHLRTDGAFEQAYSNLVKALVPVRGHVPGGAGKTRPSTTRRKREAAAAREHRTHSPTLSMSIGVVKTPSDTDLLSHQHSLKQRSASCSDLLDEAESNQLSSSSSQHNGDAMASFLGSDETSNGSGRCRTSSLDHQNDTPSTTIPNRVSSLETANSKTILSEDDSSTTLMDPSAPTPCDARAPSGDDPPVDAPPESDTTLSHDEPSIDPLTSTPHQTDINQTSVSSSQPLPSSKELAVEGECHSAADALNVSSSPLQASLHTSSTALSPPQTPSTDLLPSTAVSPPLTPAAAVSQPLTPNTAVSPPLTPNTAVSQPLTPNTAVSQPLTPNTAVSPPLTPNTAVSPPLTPNTAVSPPLTPNTAVSPPLTPNTASLAADVQELLDVLKTPLDSVDATVVKVPSLSRYNRYYRHSFKKTSVKQREADRPQVPLPSSPEEECSNHVADHLNSPVSPASRSVWIEREPRGDLLGSDHSDMFEVSGKFLSSRHLTVEEVMSDHAHICLVLQARVELVEAVMQLWANGKGLQAATNLLQGCFSQGDDNDVVLFVDTLQYFLLHQSPWTLAVCLVLLPTLRQLMASYQTLDRGLAIVCEVLLMMVQRFADLILACKGSPKKRSRLSSSVDREQQLICYRELHSLHSALYQRLDANRDPPPLANSVRKLHATLKPFKQLAS